MSTGPWPDYSIFYAWRRMRAQSKIARAGFIHAIHQAIPNASSDDYEAITEHLYQCLWNKSISDLRAEHNIDPADDSTSLRNRLSTRMLAEVTVAEDVCRVGIENGTPTAVTDILQLISLLID